LFENGVSGGRALRVAKTKQHETLENTWKAITEGQAMPLSRHVRNNTWENHGRGIVVESLLVKKSETLLFILPLNAVSDGGRPECESFIQSPVSRSKVFLLFSFVFDFWFWFADFLQRRKCTQECVFAPYFPPDLP
jgi:hypothetical protein